MIPTKLYVLKWEKFSLREIFAYYVHFFIIRVNRSQRNFLEQQIRKNKSPRNFLNDNFRQIKIHEKPDHKSKLLGNLNLVKRNGSSKDSFAKINPREINSRNQFAKINLRNLFQICKFAKINLRQKGSIMKDMPSANSSTYWHKY